MDQLLGRHESQWEAPPRSSTRAGLKLSLARLSPQKGVLLVRSYHDTMEHFWSKSFDDTEIEGRKGTLMIAMGAQIKCYAILPN